jgi:hypothetical protein
MIEEPERSHGRPPRQFTAEERNQAEVLSGIGLAHRQIAVLIGCDEKTLRKHLGEELTRGDAKATAKIAQSLFSKAMSGDTASMIFWMKVRAGWSERVVQEHTGAGGDGPMCLNVRFVDRPPSETREQWVARRERELDQNRRVLDAPAGTAD